MNRMASPLPWCVQCTALSPPFIDRLARFAGAGSEEPADAKRGPRYCPHCYQRRTKEHGCDETSRAHAGICKVGKPCGNRVNPCRAERTQSSAERRLVEDLLDQAIEETADP